MIRKLAGSLLAVAFFGCCAHAGGPFGSGAAPAASVPGATGSVLYSDGAGSMAATSTFKFNSSSKILSVDGALIRNMIGLGNVTSASYAIDLSSSTQDVDWLRFCNTSAGGTCWIWGTTGSGGALTAGAVYFYNASANAIKTVILPSGAMGVGTSTPSQMLHVKDGTIQVDGTGAPTTGQALCFDSNHVLGHCTSVVGAGGGCTCTAP